MSTSRKCKIRFAYTEPQPGKTPKPLPLSSLQEVLHRDVPTGHKDQSPPTRHTVPSAPTPPFPHLLFLHSGKTHYLFPPHTLGERNHSRILLVVVRYYFVCMFSKASGHRVRQARASVQQCCCELPSAQVAHCLGTMMKYSGFSLIAQNAPEIARSGGKVQCRR